jgi:hypothetical protein
MSICSQNPRRGKMADGRTKNYGKENIQDCSYDMNANTGCRHELASSPITLATTPQPSSHSNGSMQRNVWMNGVSVLLDSMPSSNQSQMVA